MGEVTSAEADGTSPSIGSVVCLTDDDALLFSTGEVWSVEQEQPVDP